MVEGWPQLGVQVTVKVSLLHSTDTETSIELDAPHFQVQSRPIADQTVNVQFLHPTPV